MSYLLARLRLWAAHHRVIWWTGAATLAVLTGITVRAAAEADPGGPTGDERGVAIGRGNDPLAVQVGDRLDLWSVADIAARGRLVVSGARVLDHDDRTVTVAIPADRVGDAAPALGRGDLLTALVP